MENNVENNNFAPVGIVGANTKKENIDNTKVLTEYLEKNNQILAEIKKEVEKINHKVEFLQKAEEVTDNKEEEKEQTQTNNNDDIISLINNSDINTQTNGALDNLNDIGSVLASASNLNETQNTQAQVASEATQPVTPEVPVTPVTPTAPTAPVTPVAAPNVQATPIVNNSTNNTNDGILSMDELLKSSSLNDNANNENEINITPDVRMNEPEVPVTPVTPVAPVAAPEAPVNANIQTQSTPVMPNIEAAQPVVSEQAPIPQVQVQPMPNINPEPQDLNTSNVQILDNIDLSTVQGSASQRSTVVTEEEQTNLLNKKNAKTLVFQK